MRLFGLRVFAPFLHIDKPLDSAFIIQAGLSAGPHSRSKTFPANLPFWDCHFTSGAPQSGQISMLSVSSEMAAWVFSRSAESETGPGRFGSVLSARNMIFLSSLNF